MHKGMKAAVLGLCVAVAVAGCGRVSTTQKKTLNDFQKITKEPSVYFSSFKKFNALTDISSLSLTADADPNVTTERHTAETTAKIYSSATTSSGVIGEFKEDDEVMVIEKMTGTNWYKIVYNGRVAYVQASVLEVKSDSAGSYNNYIGYSDDAEDFDEAAAHSGDTYDGDDEPGTVPEPTEDPGDEPGGDEPGGDEPGGDEPGGDEPGGDEPGGDEPGGDEPGGDEPGGDEPGGDEPGGDEPGGDEPLPEPEPGEGDGGESSSEG